MLSWDPQIILLWAGALCGAASLLLLVVWMGVSWRQRQQGAHLRRVVAHRAGKEHRQENSRPVSAAEQFKDRASSVGELWLQGRFGNSLLAKEDRQLLNNSGYRDLNLARHYFVLARGVLSLGLALLFNFLPGVSLLNTTLPFVASFFGFALGWMLPKWFLMHRALRRRRQIAEELPLFVDMLRLLQGVGLSIDQTLHTIERDFQDVLPVLGAELSIAIEQYARGRTRAQSLERLAKNYGNDDVDLVCRLITQVDQHGGAMQEPLHRFGVRLREQRRLELKERVGKLTVKMTGVMVLTLLPALLIITAGSGFLALFRGLGRVAGG